MFLSGGLRYRAKELIYCMLYSEEEPQDVIDWEPIFSQK